METRLTYPSSLRLIRAARRDPSFMVERLDKTPVWNGDEPARANAHEAMLARPDEPHALRPDAKLSVLVPHEGGRSRSMLRSFRICEGNLPPASFVRVSRPGFRPIVVESPELCIVRAASDLALRVRQGYLDKGVALIRLVELIDELCGRYARHPASPRSEQLEYDLEPITSVELFSRYLQDAKRIHGLVLARQALPHALDNLGSPMEALIEMACCLPPHLGGVGLPRPVSNRPLDFSDHERLLVSHRTLRPDHYWEKYRIACEYNGDSHDGEKADVEDDRRVSDYQACGIRVFPARFENVCTEKGLVAYLRKIVDAMAQVEGQALERRVFRILDSSSCRQARQALLDTMLPPASCT